VSESIPNPGPEQYTTIDTTVVEWDKSFNPKLGVELGRLMLRKDPKNGAEIRMIRYPKGVVNPEHTHPCGHGIFVLEGKLRTHEGTYGPGTWVWFPQGERFVAGRARRTWATVGGSAGHTRAFGTGQPVKAIWSASSSPMVLSTFFIKTTSSRPDHPG
jgi:quercetin dioxygenase-like cupin family protein